MDCERNQILLSSFPGNPIIRSNMRKESLKKESFHPNHLYRSTFYFLIILQCRIPEKTQFKIIHCPLGEREHRITIAKDLTFKSRLFPQFRTRRAGRRINRTFSILDVVLTPPSRDGNFILILSSSLYPTSFPFLFRIFKRITFVPIRFVSWSL